VNINIITLFPEFFQSPLASGLMRRAIDKQLLGFTLLNPRSFTDDKRQTVDDRPYGGGPGMVMLLEPLARALHSLGFGAKNFSLKNYYQNYYQDQTCNPGRLLVMSPQGRPFCQQMARELAQEEKLTILCARYEGFDARLAELFPLEPVSLGDFILNGGESAALAICEATGRLLPGFMGHEESGLEESFSAGLLEYPHYTRPEEYAGFTVPDILLGGNHAEIARWRRQESLAATLERRPDLLLNAPLTPEDLDYLHTQFKNRPPKKPCKNLSLALLHYPVLDKEQNTAHASLTNLDIHDIARSACTYGLANFFVAGLQDDQELILKSVLEHWVRGAGGKSNPDRKTALSRISSAKNLESVLEQMEQKTGERPLIWGSSADYRKEDFLPNSRKNKQKKADLHKRIISFDEAGKILYTHSAVLLLGTGHGLAPEILEQCDHLLPPVRRFAEYNHLSVRSAGAVLLDRLLGEWG
jgi:tRNA (guanine37-N1)-methyltransferase